MIRLLRRLRCLLSSHLSVTVWPDDGSPPIVRCWRCGMTRSRLDLILGAFALVLLFVVLFVVAPT